MSQKGRQRSLLFPLLVVFVGLMLLLINLGVIDRSIWSDLIRFWPVMLILIGIDTLLRRSSAGAAFGALVSTAVLIAVGITLFHLFAPESWGTQTQPFSHALNGAGAADIVLACQDCSMDIHAAPASNALITGSVTLRRDERLSESVRYQGNTVQFELESEYWLPFLFTAERGTHIWQAGLNPAIPLSLSLEAGGTVDVDLTDLAVSTVDISAGEERCRITLGGAATTLFLSGDRIEVYVPSDVALRVVGSASMGLIVPSDYVERIDGFYSSNYDSNADRSEIVLRSGAHWVEIRSL